ncbi:MAG TPA: sensor histidine kinase [Chloroflexota bacterium]|nr:sensor histidine kinase [Chloroflexota bacterium]
MRTMEPRVPGQYDHEIENGAGGKALPRRPGMPWLVSGEIEGTRRDRRPLIWSDVGLALLMSFLVLAESSGGPWSHMNPTLILMTLPLIWRRQYPVPVFGLTVLGALFANGVVPQSLPAYSGLGTIMIAAYSVGVYSRYWLLSLCLILGTATVVAMTVGTVLPRLPNFAGSYIVLLPVWVVGQAIRSRQLRADAFEDKVTRLEREQEMARQAARAAERARIARELHDVVAHSVSVMVVQAGAARHIVREAPAQAHEALSAVESSGREAMAELRRLLGVLTYDSDEDPVNLQLAPQPGTEQLAALVRRVRDAGLPVNLSIRGQIQTLSPGMNLAVYRIVQEALTNALKYAGQACTEVILSYGQGRLEVKIHDQGRGCPESTGAATGHGLAGMRERVALYGGRLEAGPDRNGGFLVRAWLPLESDGP